MVYFLPSAVAELKAGREFKMPQGSYKHLVFVNMESQILHFEP